MLHVTSESLSALAKPGVESGLSVIISPTFGVDFNEGNFACNAIDADRQDPHEGDTYSMAPPSGSKSERVLPARPSTFHSSMSGKLIPNLMALCAERIESARWRTAAMLELLEYALPIFVPAAQPASAISDAPTTRARKT